MRVPTIIPSQNITVNLFTPDTNENINNILSMILPDNKPIQETISCHNGIISSYDCFRIEALGNQISLSDGICIVHNVLIEINQKTYINLNDINSCLYITDTIPTNDGEYSAIISLKYNPSISDPNAYIGLIYDNSLYAMNTQDLILFGLVKFKIINNAYSIINVTYNDADFNIFRSIPMSIIDGGNINDPIMS